MGEEEAKDPMGYLNQLPNPPIAPPVPKIDKLSAGPPDVQREENNNEREVNHLNRTIEENTIMEDNAIMEDNIDDINKTNNDDGVIGKLSDMWKSKLIPTINQVPQITFIYKIIFAVFVYLLLTYILDKMLFFYDLTSDIGYIYYTWITILIFFFIILPVKSVYFDYLN
tara:strand:- start:13 stop:519 length:507 start_codon:yes stop_codon:yes gene_type:complete